MFVNDIFHDPKMISAQVLFTSNGDFLFTTEACSPKRTEIRCWWVELDPGITKTIPPSFPPKNPPQSPHHPDTFIPKKTVVVDEGVNPRFLQPVFWFWK